MLCASLKKSTREKHDNPHLTAFGEEQSLTVDKSFLSLSKIRGKALAWTG